MAGIARIASGAPWEPIFGYARAVKAGGWLAVSGTTSFDDKGLIVGRNQIEDLGKVLRMDWALAPLARRKIVKTLACVSVVTEASIKIATVGLLRDAGE